MALDTSTAGVRGLCGGAVVLPGDDAYDAGRAAWNLSADQRPALIAYPADQREVADVLAYARAAGLRVAPQATGHNAVPLGPIEDCVLLRTSAMTEVRIDPVRRIGRAGAGVLWDDVVTAAAPHGLVALHGSSPDVSVTGYSLGGGIGWLSRLHGLQSNTLTAVELVLPDGTPLRATADTEPELFWALRGGGGNFGVVTAVEFDLFELTEVYGGMLVWDLEHAGEVVGAWLEFTRDAPDAVTTALRLLHVPEVEWAPSPLRGRRLVAIDGAIVAETPEAEALLRPLRALRPELDLWQPIPAPALGRIHGDPEQPVFGTSDARLLDDLDAAGAAALVAAGPRDGSLVSGIELRQLGGALGRPAPDAGALSHLDGAFAMFAMGSAPGHADVAAAREAAAGAIAAMAPWSRGRAYLNLAERPADGRAAYPPETYDRLCALRAAVDPDGLLRANHELP